MTKDWLRYDEMVEDALRGVVRRAFSEAKKSGLPGEHHFYITFRTDADGVMIPPTLKAQYPREITIVLQHQFWDLEVHEDLFSVTLSFGGRQERLRVPFAAVVSFADPSVKFALHFDAGENPQESESGATAGQPDSSEAPPALEKPEAKPALADQRPENGKQENEQQTKDAEKEAAKSGATVVALDSFRKKH